jgi:hypothetical protein
MPLAWFNKKIVIPACGAWICDYCGKMFAFKGEYRMKHKHKTGFCSAKCRVAYNRMKRAA